MNKQAAIIARLLTLGQDLPADRLVYDVYDTAMEKRMKDPAYTEVTKSSDAVNAILQQIEDVLPDDQKSLTIRLCNVIGDQVGAAEFYGFDKGFQTAMSLVSYGLQLQPSAKYVPIEDFLDMHDMTDEEREHAKALLVRWDNGDHEAGKALQEICSELARKGKAVQGDE